MKSYLFNFTLSKRSEAERVEGARKDGRCQSDRTTNVPAIMSWSACFLSVHPAIM